MSKIKFTLPTQVVEIPIESESLKNEIVNEDGTITSEPVVLLLKTIDSLDVRFEYPKLLLKLQKEIKESGLSAEELSSNSEMSLEKFTILEKLLKHQVEMVKLLAIKFKGESQNITHEDIDNLSLIGVIPQIIEKNEAVMAERKKLDEQKKS